MYLFLGAKHKQQMCSTFTFMYLDTVMAMKNRSCCELKKDLFLHFQKKNVQKNILSFCAYLDKLNLIWRFDFWLTSNLAIGQAVWRILE